MRISDWSSDVCSSDLPGLGAHRGSGGLGRCASDRDGRVRDPEGPSLRDRGGRRGAQAGAVGRPRPSPCRSPSVLRVARAGTLRAGAGGGLGQEHGLRPRGTPALSAEELVVGKVCCSTCRSWLTASHYQNKKRKNTFTL